MIIQIDAAVPVGTQPKAPRSNLGLVLPTRARFQTLFAKQGLTAAGRYYYNKTGILQPGQFNFQQDATRKGTSQYIKLLDGAQKKIVHEITSNAKAFYAKVGDRYTIIWPVRI